MADRRNRHPRLTTIIGHVQGGQFPAGLEDDRWGVARSSPKKITCAYLRVSKRNLYCWRMAGLAPYSSRIAEKIDGFI
jgi:hypothetical protein